MTQKPHSSVNIYCVFVFVDQKAEDLFKVRYKSYFREILTININNQNFQENFFEFSGYKFGYDLIMNNYTHRNKKIVFINDTFFALFFCLTISLVADKLKPKSQTICISAAKDKEKAIKPKLLTPTVLTR